MKVPIVLPDLGASAARVSLWYVRPGEVVYEGDRVAEVLIPGVTFDVAAPASGVLRDRSALPGDSVFPGQELGAIEVDQ